VTLILDTPATAEAVYRRLIREGQIKILGTADADTELTMWRGDGGQGRPPLAWARKGDGVIRFNFSRFTRPDLAEPARPIVPPTAPAPSVLPGFARLPEHAGSQPIFGPDSKVARLITDSQEAQRIWTRLINERQMSILAYGADDIQIKWSDDGGVGGVPLAWVRTSDGVIIFNLGSFTPPTRQR
jgi:hypothetical protein